MTDNDSITNEDVYRAKAEDRKKKASEPFEKKLQAVVRMQRMEYAIAQSTGQACRKPWHTKPKQNTPGF